MPRSRLLAGCALGALLATLPAVAEAQAFAGTPTVVTGDASISDNPGGPGVPPSTDIFVLQPETVINWTVTNVAGSTFTFQPTGTVATFEGDDLADFTVLNRILPFDGNGFAISSAALLDGTVESYVNPVGGDRAIGGQVWFYSPGGLIAGLNSVFNVGSLMLTTNDVQFTPNGPMTFELGSIYGPGGTVQMIGTPDAISTVQIQPGAQINATGTLNSTNAYVALVAPRIEQNGYVSADGNIAYIAAEAVDMTINGGLFDFTVTAGTTDPEGIVHRGTTTGPASTSFFGDQQRISMVALPKNDALTMLLQGTIGYTPALSAFDDGSSIVLSAGYTTAEPFRPVLDPLGSIDIGPASFLNSTVATASNDILLHPKGGTITFGGNALLSAEDDIDVNVQTRENLFVNGDLTLRAGVPGQGGDITVLAENSDFLPGGVIDVAGTFSLDASSDGILFTDVPPADQFGGRISITADGGVIEASSIFAEVNGIGGFGNPGGLGDGGQINLVTEGFTGAIRADVIYAYALGIGGQSGDVGGNGVGGSIDLFENDGAFDFGSVYLAANGGGGASSTVAGNGIGGTVVVTITEQAQTWDSLSIDTGSSPGGAAIESFGLTGSASGSEDGAILRVSGPGSLTVLSDLIMTSNANMEVNGASGFSGEGGRVTIEVTDGGTLTVQGTLFAHASALLGSSEFSFFDTPDSSPTQTGGRVEITASGGGLIDALALDARAEATGLFAQTAAGSATGGEVTVSVLDGGRFEISEEATGLLATISANAYGAPGPVASDAQGGRAQLIVDDGAFVLNGDLEISADALGGEFFSPPPEGFGFNAAGGTASIELRAGSLGTAEFSANDVAISAVGDGTLNISLFSGEGVPPTPTPLPIAGDGGDGTGGSASLTIGGGEFIVADLTLDSSGKGGGSGISPEDFPFASGDGFGGSTFFQITGGEATTVGSLNLVSNGEGGDATVGPAAEGNEVATLAGNGSGGFVTLQLDGGDLNAADTALEANGYGSRGMDQIDDGEASDGGIGSGGNVSLSSAADWTGSFTTGSLTLTANGEGGDGGFSTPPASPPSQGFSGDGGTGFGGSASVILSDGEFSLGPVEIQAIGQGGDSGDAAGSGPGAQGGEGVGGSGVFSLVDSPAGPAGARTLAGLSINTSGNGGFGPGSAPGLSEDGDLFVTVDVLDAASALSITGDLSLFNNGGPSGPGTGIDLTIDGAPLTIGGAVMLSATEDVVIDAGETLHGLQSVQIGGHSVQSTGLVRADGFLSVGGSAFIQAENFSSGDFTTLVSFGPITVDNLTSVGQVSANGGSIEIHSTEGLDFLLAQANIGDLWIETQDDLHVASLSAIGSVTLESNAGNIGTGDFTAGTFAYVDAFGTADLGNILAGNDVAVTTRGGNLTVGNVLAGDDVWLSVFGTNAGSVLTAGNIEVTGSGDDEAAGPSELFGAFPNSAGPAGNVVRVRSSGSVVAGDVQTPGRAILVADQGTMTLGDLTGDEALVLLGRGDIALGSATTDGVFYVADSAMFATLSETYDPASLTGLDPVLTAGNVTATGLVVAGRASVAAGGNATFPALHSGGTTFLEAGGTVDIDELVSAGRVDLSAGDGAFIDGTGALTFGIAEATNQLSIVTPGNLAFGSVDAGSNLTLRSTGGSLSVTGNVAGGSTVLNAAGAIAISGNLEAGGPLSATAGSMLTVAGAASASSANLNATGGIDLAALTSGGTTRMIAGNGAITVDQLLSSGLVTARGGSVDITSTGALGFADVETTTGDLSVTAVGDITLFAGEGLDDVDVFGAASLISSDGAVTSQRAITVGGPATIEGHDGVTIPALTSGGATELHSAAGTVDIDNLISSGIVNVTAGNSVFIGGTGALTFDTAEALNELSIVTTGDLTLGSVSSGLNLTLGSTGGELTATGDVQGIYGNITAAGDILFEGNLNSGGNLSVTAGGSFTVEGDTQTGDAHILADRGITMTSLTTGEVTFLEALNGNIVVPELIATGRVTARGLDVNIASSESLLFDEVRAFEEDVRIDVAQDLLIGSGFADNQMILTAGRNFTLLGDARAFLIDVTSENIHLGEEARLGVQDATQSVTLHNGNSGNLTIIGGDGGTEGPYNLDRNEIRRIFADDSISIFSNGDIAIEDFSLSFGPGSTNIGPGGLLEISTPGTVDIVGDIELTASGPDDTFLIDPRLIAIHTDTGSISMFSGEGANANGRIELVADTVIAATDTVIDQLDGMTDLDQITDLLSQPGGSGDTISAGSVDISVIDGLYIQNSGASDDFDDRRGFAAGAINIDTESSDTQIAINGQILRPTTSGGPVTGLEVADLVSINGEPAAAGGDFDPRSSINGCVIGTDCSFVPEPEPEPEHFQPPSDDDLDPVDPGEPAGGFIVAPLIELAGTEPLIDPPLVDEPITGVGNDDLWQPPCDPEDDNGPCPEGGEEQ